MSILTKNWKDVIPDATSDNKGLMTKDLVALVTQLAQDLGTLADLETTDKTSIVNAINEVASSSEWTLVVNETTTEEVNSVDFTFASCKNIYMEFVIVGSATNSSNLGFRMLVNSNTNTANRIIDTSDGVRSNSAQVRSFFLTAEMIADNVINGKISGLSSSDTGSVYNGSAPTTYMLGGKANGADLGKTISEIYLFAKSEGVFGVGSTFKIYTK